MPSLRFFYDFASTYSYLSAMRIDDLASTAGVTVVWQPILLGPIFATQGWTTSPFNLYPAKGRHMWRDMARLAAAQGLAPVVAPDPFPQNGLAAARCATALPDDGSRAAFTRAVYRAEFAEGRAIADLVVLSECLTEAGLEPSATLRAAQSDAVKSALRAATDEAQAADVFGAPSFVTDDGELFWGNDRLESALAWATAARPALG